MTTFGFIDASNLFYGGEKSLGWKVDYEKLAGYLKEKYGVSRILYFGGVETHTFEYSYLENETVPLEELSEYLSNLIKAKATKMNEAELFLVGRHLQRVKFYQKLDKFGYELCLKPVKLYKQEDGTTKRKANCDVDMAFHIMKEKDSFTRAIVLSGDGDFLPLLKYLKEQGKEVVVLSRGVRTAREIRQFVGANFRDFVRLEHFIRYVGK